MADLMVDDCRKCIRESVESEVACKLSWSEEEGSSVISEEVSSYCEDFSTSMILWLWCFVIEYKICGINYSYVANNFLW